MTLCLFTSQDMGDASGLPIPYGQNYYPMNQTMLWRLKDGQDASKPGSWTPEGPVINEENALTDRGVPTNAYHQWAPGVRYWVAPGDVGKYYLYVPDVLDTNDESHTSRINLFTTSDPLGIGPYFYGGEVASQLSQPNNGYQSDPNMFIDSDNSPYLVYANGDASNCGGLSMGKLDFSLTSWTSGGPQPIGISGWGDNLGNCGSSGHPYLEGPALYLSKDIGAPATNPKYTLIFAAKPNAIPTGCSDTQNYEVIAYATAKSVTGPYTYKGVIMCGSATEWTNQASVVQSTNISFKYLFAWHDGGGKYHNRRTHLMCLRWDSAGKALQIPRSSANLSNCP